MTKDEYIYINDQKMNYTNSHAFVCSAKTRTDTQG